MYKKGYNIELLSGKIRVGSNHPTYSYEVVFYCEPSNEEMCNKCPYRWYCFTNQELVIAFYGDKIGIFPPYWKSAKPTNSELEQYLFGKCVNILQLREIPSFVECKIQHASNDK